MSGEILDYVIILSYSLIPLVITMIDFFRQQPLMYFFSKLDSIRVKTISFSDEKHDQEGMERLEAYKKIVNRETCLSDHFDSEDNICLKASFPDKLDDLNGMSNEIITIELLYWRYTDIEQLFKKINRAEYLEIEHICDAQNKINELSISKNFSIEKQENFLKKFLSTYNI